MSKFGLPSPLLCLQCSRLHVIGGGKVRPLWEVMVALQIRLRWLTTCNLKVCDG